MRGAGQTAGMTETSPSSPSSATADAGAPPPADLEQLLALAADHGLDLLGDSLRTEEIGLDFRVAFARSRDGQDWVLRIPRRAEVLSRAAVEGRLLAHLAPHLDVAIPDWRISTARLIAYPLLPGTPGLTVDPDGSVRWHLDMASTEYALTLGIFLAQLHAVDPVAAAATGIPSRTPEQVRAGWREDLARVAEAFPIAPALRERWEAWLAKDSYWPDLSVLTHGEVYPGHTLVRGERLSAVLDWTTAPSAIRRGTSCSTARALPRRPSRRCSPPTRPAAAPSTHGSASTPRRCSPPPRSPTASMRWRPARRSIAPQRPPRSTLRTPTEAGAREAARTGRRGRTDRPAAASPTDRVPSADRAVDGRCEGHHRTRHDSHRAIPNRKLTASPQVSSAQNAPRRVMPSNRKSKTPVSSGPGSLPRGGGEPVRWPTSEEVEPRPPGAADRPRPERTSPCPSTAPTPSALPALPPSAAASAARPSPSPAAPSSPPA